MIILRILKYTFDNCDPRLVGPWISGTLNTLYWHPDFCLYTL